MNFEAMGSEDSRSLEIWFYEEEAYGTLSGLCEDKSPSFDGFTMALWQLCWDFVKHEAMSISRDLYDNDSFKRSLNITFLVLILKKGNRGLERF